MIVGRISRILRLLRVRPRSACWCSRRCSFPSPASWTACSTLRDLCAGLHRAAAGLDVLPGAASPLRRGHQADHRTVPARHGDRRHRLPARTTRRWACWAIAALALLRFGQGFALGGSWNGLASLLALDGAARNSAAGTRCWPSWARPSASSWPPACSPTLVQPVPGRLLCLGLALSVLRGLRHQRGRAVRATAHDGGAAIRRADETRATWSRRRSARLVRTQGRQHRAGRVRAAGQLCAVPPGDDLRAVLGAGVHQAVGHHVLLVQIVGALVAIPCMFLSGWFADRFGRRITLAVFGVLIAIYSGWTALMLAGGTLAGLSVHHLRLRAARVSRTRRQPARSTPASAAISATPAP